MAALRRATRSGELLFSKRDVLVRPPSRKICMKKEGLIHLPFLLIKPVYSSSIFLIVLIGNFVLTVILKR
nr:MAG TPA: hypothetical protein [Caudoviricetes sp.]